MKPVKAVAQRMRDEGIRHAILVVQVGPSGVAGRRRAAQLGLATCLPACGRLPGCIDAA